MGGSQTGLHALHLSACVKILNRKQTEQAGLHHTSCPPTTGISTGERHLITLQSLVAFKMHLKYRNG